MPDAAYYRAWRAAHPEYRKRDTQRRTQAKRAKPRNRATEYAKRPSRAIVLPDFPTLHTGHPLFDRARAIVGPRRTTLTTLHDPLYDDLIAVATLAILEGTDPKTAVAEYRTRELRYGRLTAPLNIEEIA